MTGTRSRRAFLRLHREIEPSMLVVYCDRIRNLRLCPAVQHGCVVGVDDMRKKPTNTWAANLYELLPPPMHALPPHPAAPPARPEGPNRAWRKLDPYLLISSANFIATAAHWKTCIMHDRNAYFSRTQAPLNLHSIDHRAC
jgi:hypothetical protein